MFAALWRRKWIIAAVTLLAAIVAGAYLAGVEPNYKSSTTARASTFLTDSVASGSIAGVTADVDPSIIMTPTILQPAADAVGEPVAAVAGSVSYEVIVGLRTNNLEVTANGPTPESAQARAQAVMQSYSDYVDATIQTTLTSLQDSVASTTDQIRAYQTQLAANPNDPIAAQNLATALSSLSGYNAQIVAIQNAGAPLTVTAPAPPGSSTNPSMMIVAALALVCGLLAGAGIALVRDFFDDRIRASDEVEPLTGVPAIAELANDRRVARKKMRLPAGSAERTALSEGIRSLRTTIQVMLPEGKGAVVITSVEPGDGKTFLSTNLAVSWARAGRKVILVGGDLRRGQLGSYFYGMNNASGLGDLLSDAAALRRAPNQAQILDQLQTTSYRGLRVMPSGLPKDEPADLLGGRHLGRVIANLVRSADVVVIDSPPALALADASELASHAVGVILVATVNRTRRALLRDTVANLRANGIEVLGIVVNRSRRRLPRSYSSYYVDARGGRAAATRPVSRPSPQPLENEQELLAVDDGADDAAPKREGRSVSSQSARPSTAPPAAHVDLADEDSIDLAEFGLADEGVIEDEPTVDGAIEGDMTDDDLTDEELTDEELTDADQRRLNSRVLRRDGRQRTDEVDVDLDREEPV